jgi:hypothetical protein
MEMRHRGIVGICLRIALWSIVLYLILWGALELIQYYDL